MKKNKIHYCFTAVLSFFVILLSTPVLADYIANENAKQIAEGIMDRSITDDELIGLKMGYDEFIMVAIEVAVLNNADREDIIKFIKSNDKLFRKNFYSSSDINLKVDIAQSNESTSLLLKGSCTQYIEKEDGTTGQTYAYSYADDWMCDCDNSDLDYKFDFNPSWTDDPSDVRWWATYYVRTVFTTVYGGNLLGSSLCTSPLQMCLGTNGVALAGGRDNVQEEMYIWHK